MKKTVVKSYSLDASVAAAVDGEVRAGLSASKIVNTILKEHYNGKSTKKAARKK